MSSVLHQSPRLLHPAAWWLWGLAMAAAASRTTNPFLLVLIIAVVGWVVLERRELGMVNPFFVGPLLGVGAASLAGVPLSGIPGVVLAGAQIMLGVSLGMAQRAVASASPRSSPSCPTATTHASASAA